MLPWRRLAMRRDFLSLALREYEMASSLMYEGVGCTAHVNRRLRKHG